MREGLWEGGVVYNVKKEPLPRGETTFSLGGQASSKECQANFKSNHVTSACAIAFFQPEQYDMEENGLT